MLAWKDCGPSHDLRPSPQLRRAVGRAIAILGRGRRRARRSRGRARRRGRGARRRRRARGALAAPGAPRGRRARPCRRPRARRPLSFAQPLVREAVYGNLSPLWRAAQHARAARILERAGRLPSDGRASAARAARGRPVGRRAAAARGADGAGARHARGGDRAPPPRGRGAAAADAPRRRCSRSSARRPRWPMRRRPRRTSARRSRPRRTGAGARRSGSRSVASCSRACAAPRRATSSRRRSRRPTTTRSGGAHPGGAFAALHVAPGRHVAHGPRRTRTCPACAGASRPSGSGSPRSRWRPSPPARTPRSCTRSPSGRSPGPAARGGRHGREPAVHAHRRALVDRPLSTRRSRTSTSRSSTPAAMDRRAPTRWRAPGAPARSAGPAGCSRPRPTRSTRSRWPPSTRSRWWCRSPSPRCSPCGSSAGSSIRPRRSCATTASRATSRPPRSSRRSGTRAAGSTGRAGGEEEAAADFLAAGRAFVRAGTPTPAAVRGARTPRSPSRCAATRTVRSELVAEELALARRADAPRALGSPSAPPRCSGRPTRAPPACTTRPAVAVGGQPRRARAHARRRRPRAAPRGPSRGRARVAARGARPRRPPSRRRGGRASRRPSCASRAPGRAAPAERRRGAHRRGAADRAARRRGEDEPRDRRRAVPEPEDRRVPSRATCSRSSTSGTGASSRPCWAPARREHAAGAWTGVELRPPRRAPPAPGARSRDPRARGRAARGRGRPPG